MLPVVEIPGLTKADADQAAFDLAIDNPTIEIIQQPDGLFTVRATYPEGTIIPHATSQVPDNSAPFELTGLSQAAVDEEVAVFQGSGSTVSVVPEANNLFTVRISPPKLRRSWNLHRPSPPTLPILMVMCSVSIGSEPSDDRVWASTAPCHAIRLISIVRRSRIFSAWPWNGKDRTITGQRE